MKNECRIIKMDAVAQMCLDVFKAFGGNEKTIFKNISIYESMREMSPNNSSVIPISYWRGIRGWTEFRTIYTDEGVCFTINSINSHELYSSA